MATIIDRCTGLARLTIVGGMVFVFADAVLNVLNDITICGITWIDVKFVRLLRTALRYRIDLRLAIIKYHAMRSSS